MKTLLNAKEPVKVVRDGLKIKIFHFKGWMKIEYLKSSHKKEKLIKFCEDQCLELFTDKTDICKEIFKNFGEHCYLFTRSTNYEPNLENITDNNTIIQLYTNSLCKRFSYNKLKIFFVTSSDLKVHIKIHFPEKK